jgi:hypothetical protein
MFWELCGGLKLSGRCGYLVRAYLKTSGFSGRYDRNGAGRTLEIGPDYFPSVFRRNPVRDCAAAIMNDAS